MLMPRKVEAMRALSCFAIIVVALVCIEPLCGQSGAGRVAHPFALFPLMNAYVKVAGLALHFRVGGWPTF
jgi:hypothetical protein